MPTAHLTTLAGTLLPTTAYQSAAATGRGSIQAYAFSPGGFLGGGSFLGTSTSAPASPLDRRTLLYARERPPAGAVPGHASGHSPAHPQQQQQQRRLLPAADLLDRLTLLRRLAPATEPAPRPPALQPARTVARPALTPVPLPHSQASTPSACRRWAWDDSLLGGGSASGGSASAAGRPIAAVPAPGWHYCGELVAEDGARALQSDLASAVRLGCGEQGQGLEEGTTTVLVMRSPRQHRLCLGDDSEECADGSRAAASGSRAGGSGGRQVAFRPPGPLQHKFGNKARPRSAPSAEERARAAGLRECGCPAKSPWVLMVPAGAADARGRSVAAQAPSSRQQLAWSDPPAPAVMTAQPRSAGPVPPRRRQHASHRQHQQDSSVEVEPAVPAGTTGAARDCTASDCAETTTTTVTATGDVDVVVFSPPRAASAGGPREDVVEVTLASPHSHGRGGEAEVTVIHTSEARRPASPGLPRSAAAGWPAPAAAAAAAVVAASPHTRLTVSVPAGRPNNLSISANATSAAAASGGSSPIKAWRPQGRHASHAAGGVWAEVDATVSPLPPRRQQPLVCGGELQQLAGEIRQREQTFQSLLGELERIQRKCEKLTASTTCQAPQAAAGASAGRAPSAHGQRQHTCAAHNTGGSAPVARGASVDDAIARPATAAKRGIASRSGSGGGGWQEEGAEWTWESLQDFEASIREQQRKVGGSGCSRRLSQGPPMGGVRCVVGAPAPASLATATSVDGQSSWC